MIIELLILKMIYLFINLLKMKLKPIPCGHSHVSTPRAVLFILVRYCVLTASTIDK